MVSSFFVNYCLSTTTLTVATVDNVDQSILLEFKKGITQDPFRILSSWNDSVHFCKWTGVTCDQKQRRITKLDLQSNMLIGAIPSSIGNLSFLTVLNLQNNSFFGEVPQEIGRLYHLQELLLGNNSLGGQIPIHISNCTNLMNLSLPYNQLVGKIPMEIGYLSKLLTFSVARNLLSGNIPASLGNLSLLTNLSLPFNNFEGSVPDSLGQLTHLTFLGLGTNNLSASLFNASKLVVFDLIRNNFIGSVPTNLGGLQELFRFSVASNNLGSGKGYDLNFLTSLTNCSKLGILRISDNHFGGILPISIANLSKTLANLELGRNQIYGSIPLGIQNLANLSQLSMEENQLIGSIPWGIGELHNLKILNLHGNKLSGNVPSSIGNLAQLLDLSFANNKLEGIIPPSLQNCRYLGLLDLSQNSLNGTIPEQVISLSSLAISLNLSHNSLTGSLPPEVGSLKNLGVLDISHNRLSGAIPSAIGDCLRLEQLHMESNFFHGNIPSSLSYLKGIQDIDLSRNNLSGQVPKDLEMLPLLHNLNLSFNDLEGDVPRGGVFGNKSAISIVGNSKLCGGIFELQLAPCPNQESKSPGQSVSFKVIMIGISVLVCLVVILSFLIFYWRRKSGKKPPSTSFLDDRYLRVTYEELLKATNGFSSDNLLGVGSFGSVYKGTLRQETKPVAVKVLNLGQRGASKSFMAECQTQSKIRHRNLLKVITSCSSIDYQGNDFKALMFDLMLNGNLEHWLHPSQDHLSLRSLSFAQRLDIAIDIASALDYLHHQCQTPIIHCDLKPSNVLLDAELVAHVSDFGLAKFLSMNSDNLHKGDTSSIAVKGSIGYIAPEYAMGGEVSKRGDVYSYGILLLEMFTGKRPTDEMFKDGLNLHSFSEIALHKQVMEIVDPSLSFAELEEFCNNTEKWKIAKNTEHN
ncbi:hypothetical protein AQUCO_00500050v1, partial [Aquilegia coerulea]